MLVFLSSIGWVYNDTPDATPYDFLAIAASNGISMTRSEIGTVKVMLYSFYSCVRNLIPAEGLNVFANVLLLSFKYNITCAIQFPVWIGTMRIA